MQKNEIAQYIDHTYLKSEGTKKAISKLIEEAKQYDFKAICINPCWIKYAKEKLKSSNIKIATVIGFPLGASTTQVKVYEAKLAINHGADEIDMVINIGKFKDYNDDYVLNEIKKIKEVCKDKILKVIIETALLTKKEKIRITKIVLNSGADFIKTSTGFSYHGATIDDIKLIANITKGKIKIKASGGIKNYNDFKTMIDAGVNRIGTSNSLKIINN